ncbi:lipocalin-like domain-containing protein [Arenibaculum pallidiluteum]|uniref:lipocalin-like domain-containing protein n=1 Tax=Arenibaculum pallidiluteum TaxID=2812559 RepID=UPI001A971CDA|nr:lipocalin-like domain-containing protein [Arenibaculum pallidiluteum]
MSARPFVLAVLIGASAASAHAQVPPRNQVVGTWRLVSAQIDPEGRNQPAYGERADGLLTFTPDMRFVEVLVDGSLPRFASDVRGEGTDTENRAAMSRSLGLFGTYTIDENGEFSGNRIEGSTFPNWVGSVRTRNELTFTVWGDRMTESFRRPEGTRILVEWQRVR